MAEKQDSTVEETKIVVPIYASSFIEHYINSNLEIDYNSEKPLPNWKVIDFTRLLSMNKVDIGFEKNAIIYRANNTQVVLYYLRYPFMVPIKNNTAITEEIAGKLDNIGIKPLTIENATNIHALEEDLLAKLTDKVIDCYFKKHYGTLVDITCISEQEFLAEKKLPKHNTCIYSNEANKFKYLYYIEITNAKTKVISFKEEKPETSLFLLLQNLLKTDFIFYPQENLTYAPPEKHAAIYSFIEKKLSIVGFFDCIKKTIIYWKKLEQQQLKDDPIAAIINTKIIDFISSDLGVTEHKVVSVFGQHQLYQLITSTDTPLKPLFEIFHDDKYNQNGANFAKMMGIPEYKAGTASTKLLNYLGTSSRFKKFQENSQNLTEDVRKLLNLHVHWQNRHLWFVLKELSFPPESQYNMFLKTMTEIIFIEKMAKLTLLVDDMQTESSEYKVKHIIALLFEIAHIEQSLLKKDQVRPRQISLSTLSERKQAPLYKKIPNFFSKKTPPTKPQSLISFLQNLPPSVQKQLVLPRPVLEKNNIKLKSINTLTQRRHRKQSFKNTTPINLDFMRPRFSSNKEKTRKKNKLKVNNSFADILKKYGEDGSKNNKSSGTPDTPPSPTIM